MLGNYFVSLKHKEMDTSHRRLGGLEETWQAESLAHFAYKYNASVYHITDRTE